MSSNIEPATEQKAAIAEHARQGTSLSAHVAALPPAIKQRLLSAAGLGDVTPADLSPAIRNRSSWGFVLDLPSLSELEADAAARAQRLVDTQPLQQATADGDAHAGAAAATGSRPDAPASSAALPQPEAPAALAAAAVPEESAAAQPLFLEHLDASRLFHCPDAVDAMAEAYSIADAFNGLQGSAVTPARDAAAQQALTGLRSELRGALRSAWSHEATRRGIAAARGGAYDEALKCYQQALELDRRNVDAHVARGAALANQKQWPQAIAALDTALEIEPGDENAAKYLVAIRQRVPQVLLSPASRSPAAASRHGAPEQHRQGAPPQPRPEAPVQHRRGAPPPQQHHGGVATSVAVATAVQTPDSRRNGGEPPAGLRGSPDDGAGAPASPGSGGASGGRQRQPNMDLERALALVSDHYRSRNVSVSVGTCAAPSSLLL